MDGEVEHRVVRPVKVPSDVLMNTLFEVEDSVALGPEAVIKIFAIFLAGEILDRVFLNKPTLEKINAYPFLEGWTLAFIFLKKHRSLQKNI